MSVATRLMHAARGDLARLVAVVAVFAGLVLAHGMQCDSLMAAAGPGGDARVGGTAHTDDVRVAIGKVNDRARIGLGAGTSAASMASVPGAVLLAIAPAPDPDGLLGACLALILAVVAMVVFAGLSRTSRIIRAAALNRRRLARLSVVHPRV